MVGEVVFVTIHRNPYEVFLGTIIESDGVNSTIRLHDGTLLNSHECSWSRFPPKQSVLDDFYQSEAFDCD